MTLCLPISKQPKPKPQSSPTIELRDQSESVFVSFLVRLSGNVKQAIVASLWRSVAICAHVVIVP